MQLITHSRASSFKRCRRRHWYEYEIGLRREVDPKALRIGIAIHLGLDAHKQGKEPNDAIDIACSGYDSPRT